MLNFIYYPVSGIMWVWHWIFDLVTPNSPGGDGIAWALSVVFLVFTLRAILYKPFVKQIRTTKKMQEINPQLQAIRKKYAKDRVKMTEEMQKLQREHGFNPLLGCLPMLLQIPVFIGLFHVLRSFNRTGSLGPLSHGSMTVEATRSTPNYFFSADQVQNFLDARFFGVPLSAFITQPVQQWEAFVQPGQPIDFTRTQIAIVVVPIMIIASIATHMNSRASVARQPEAALENPQTRMMNMLALYIFPLGILVTGPFFPVAILLYWVSNNLWTYGQQHIVFGRIAAEEEAAKLAKQEKQRANAPKPGARPETGRKGGRAEPTDGDVVDGDVVDGEVTSAAVVQTSSSPFKTVQKWLRPDRGESKASESGESTDDASSGSGSGSGAQGAGPKGPATPGSGSGGAGASAAGQQSGTGHVAGKNRRGATRRKKGGRPGGRH